MSKINIAEKFANITEYYKPRIAAELNGQHVQDWLKRLREVCAGCNQELAAIGAERRHTPGCRLKTPGPRGPRTRQVALARLRTAFADAQRRQKLPGDFNPARLAQMPSKQFTEP